MSPTITWTSCPRAVMRVIAAWRGYGATTSIRTDVGGAREAGTHRITAPDGGVSRLRPHARVRRGTAVSSGGFHPRRRPGGFGPGLGVRGRSVLDDDGC